MLELIYVVILTNIRTLIKSKKKIVVQILILILESILEDTDINCMFIYQHSFRGGA